MITEKLVFENRQGDYLISMRDTDSLRKLVEFSELTEYWHENDWGQIRLCRSKVDDSLVLQLRGRTGSEYGEKKNLVATARLSLKDLQQITYTAEELCSGVRTPECDALRKQVQEQQNTITALNLQIKELNDQLSLMVEG